MKKQNEKVFVIVNSYLVGDILLVNSLVQNIKRIYKNSKVIMLSSPTFIDLCKYQKGVDEVIIWDRHGEHKGFFGMLKFAFKFPYKKVFASFPIYGTDRPILLSWLLGSKYVLFRDKKNIFKYLLKRKYKFDEFKGSDGTMQYRHLNLLKGITKEELIDCKMQYFIDTTVTSPIEEEKDYVVLCPISSRKSKDMPEKTVIDIIKSINKKVVILGSGQPSRDLSEKLKKENLENLIDLTDKTTLQQAAKVIKGSNGVISVDTGLMHMACALNMPVVPVFYEVKETPFMPDENMYKAKIIFENQTPDTIINTLNALLNKEKNNE